MYLLAVTRPIRPTGTFTQKIQCQDANSTIQPPSVGPISGPTRPGIATKLIARMNCSRGNARSTASRPTGNSSAPPRPWITREATKICRLGDSAHSTEPSANKAIADMNTRRVPNRSASQPEAGISTAMASEYATITECICSGLSPSSSAMAGSAVLTMVASSVCMKKPSDTSHRSLFLVGDSSAAVAVGVGVGGMGRTVQGRQSEGSECATGHQTSQAHAAKPIKRPREIAESCR
ncbi:hypothetical protein SDC9_165833 [bioreactor metagenome]|uniref:Uncharacterized protein n=1 Tax=bioreactor metagenome TaxID=1076179 RepID=A0A645G2X8_9ZZZZ